MFIIDIEASVHNERVSSYLFGLNEKYKLPTVYCHTKNFDGKRGIGNGRKVAMVDLSMEAALTAHVVKFDSRVWHQAFSGEEADEGLSLGCFFQTAPKAYKFPTDEDEESLIFTIAFEKRMYDPPKYIVID